MGSSLPLHRRTGISYEPVAVGGEAENLYDDSDGISLARLREPAQNSRSNLLHHGLGPPASLPDGTQDSCIEKQKSKVEKQNYLCMLWWFELAAICASICALLAIFAIVFPYRRQRPIPEWPADITINTIISTLSVLLRAGLAVATAEALSQQKWVWFRRNQALADLSAFDQASRGAGGALKLFLTLSRWSWMGSFGATIIVLTVAIGPCLQQVVRYQSCSLPSSSSPATISRQGFFLSRGLSVGLQYNDPSISMQKSIYASIFAPQSIVLSPDCTSGNCSFTTPYHTLGYFSYCDDLSDQLNVIVNITNVTSNSDSGPPNTQTITTVNYTLPSGSYLSNGNVDSVISSAGSTTFVSTSNAHGLTSIAHQIIWTADYAAIPTGKHCTEDERQDPLLSWSCRGYGAAQCFIKPCVYTNVAEVKGGTLNETTLSKNTQWGIGGNQEDLTTVYLPCLTQDQRSQLQQVGYAFNDSTTWLPYNHSLTLDGFWSYGNDSMSVDNATTDIVPSTCIYQFTLDAVIAIDYWLSTILEGNITSDGSSYTGPATVQVMYNASKPSFAFIQDLFTNISMGITTNIRQTGNTSYATATSASRNVSDVVYALNKVAPGIMLETHTCVSVRWGWLAFPAAVTVLTLIFVIVTIAGSAPPAQGAPSTSYKDQYPATTAHDSVSIWKSSLLPLLYHGLEDKVLRTQHSFRPLSLDEMEEATKTTQVRMAPGKDGWKLTKIE